MCRFATEARLLYLPDQCHRRRCRALRISAAGDAGSPVNYAHSSKAKNRLSSHRGESPDIANRFIAGAAVAGPIGSAPPGPPRPRPMWLIISGILLLLIGIQYGVDLRASVCPDLFHLRHPVLLRQRRVRTQALHLRRFVFQDRLDLLLLIVTQVQRLGHSLQSLIDCRHLATAAPLARRPEGPALARKPQRLRAATQQSRPNIRRFFSSSNAPGHSLHEGRGNMCGCRGEGRIRRQHRDPEAPEHLQNASHPTLIADERQSDYDC